MALARVVTFDNVDAERFAQMTQEMESGGRPDEVPASEILVLHDADEQRSLVILFFESEEDYSRGDAALSAMDPGETPGRRTSVSKYEVAFRMAD